MNELNTVLDKVSKIKNLNCCFTLFFQNYQFLAFLYRFSLKFNTNISIKQIYTIYEI